MGKRLLVFAPHPDDESLGAGGLMAKAQRQGDDIFVVWLTLGDGFVEDAARYYLSLDVKPEEYLHMGYERQMETVRAMAEIGVPEQHLFFLGFPDGGLDALWRTHWDESPWMSTTTGHSSVSYLSAWRPDVPYLGRPLLSLLLAIYEEVRPDSVILPSAFDTHPDHWATNAFATLAWAEMTRRDVNWRRVPRWGYLVHWPTWPSPLAYRPQMPAKVPQEIRRLEQEPWHTESLEESAVERKRRALLAHESQAELIKLFMMAFCRSTEVFAEEDHWSAPALGAGISVRNPQSDWRSRLLGRQNPLTAVTWQRGSGRDQVGIDLRGGWAKEQRLEVSLHVVDGRDTYFHWMIGEDVLPTGMTLARRSGGVTITWPREWIGDADWVMGGVQVFNQEKLIGRVPVRLLAMDGS